MDSIKRHVNIIYEAKDGKQFNTLEEAIAYDECIPEFTEIAHLFKELLDQRSITRSGPHLEEYIKLAKTFLEFYDVKRKQK